MFFSLRGASGGTPITGSDKGAGFARRAVACLAHLKNFQRLAYLHSLFHKLATSFPDLSKERILFKLNEKSTGNIESLIWKRAECKSTDLGWY
jgi:hypothetical protein